MEIDAKKIAQWQKDGKDFTFLDVRRDDERELVHLGGIHIPLDQLQDRFGELPRDKRPLIVYCHHGGPLSLRDTVSQDARL